MNRKTLAAMNQNFKCSLPKNQILIRMSHWTVAFYFILVIIDCQQYIDDKTIALNVIIFSTECNRRHCHYAQNDQYIYLRLGFKS
jgi:hypothetical protein